MMGTVGKHGQRCPSRWRRLYPPGLRVVPRRGAAGLFDPRCRPSAVVIQSLSLSELGLGEYTNMGQT